MKQAFIKLHLSILIAGFTGIFGKLITLNEGLLVWYRMLITAILLFFMLWISKKLQRVPLKDMLRIGGVGLLLGLHWVFFYASIKASNVSIGVVCFSIAGFFTAIFEPIINRHRISFKELLFSIVALFGIFLIFHFDTRYRTGIILGTVSSALAALFVITNKKVSITYNWGTTLFYEIVGGFACLSLLLPIYLHFFPVGSFVPSKLNIIYLLLFSLVCTIGLYMLQIQALKHISAFTLNLSYNLEPIYSIILAMIIFGEAKDLDPAFYIGLGLIILSVILQMWSVMRQRKKSLQKEFMLE
ncbi:MULTISPECIES: DMT family transporter [unclassified Dysgonomonas]|uniref:DMT family transporter n=1 Tax=unclassified Dysgonomonas TaxID=2630389 RepID=UPI0013ED59C9|nr:MULTISPECIES: EamA family transporter [unclassified Dysgonomonas]